ncbi:MAG: homoserine kinase [Planctomycetota bacterium]|nr:homoserine kinase [Planctomycetota bacterium]
MTRWRIHAPASSANLGPGFDVLGLALQLGITLELEPDSKRGFAIEISGEGADTLPTDRSNRILSIATEIAGEAVEKAHWKIHSEIPVARGLGSSAAAHGCAVAAGLLLRDGTPPDREQLFQQLSSIEGHPDNAAACIEGGLQAGSGTDSQRKHVALRLESEPNVLTVIPEVPLETKHARAALPDTYRRQDVIANLAAMATLVAGLSRGDWQAVKLGCADRLHQPFRLPLIPGLAAALEALQEQPQLAGCWLSGAGPTLAAFVPDRQIDESVSRSALAALEQAGTPARARILPIERDGLRMEQIQ